MCIASQATYLHWALLLLHPLQVVMYDSMWGILKVLEYLIIDMAILLLCFLAVIWRYHASLTFQLRLEISHNCLEIIYIYIDMYSQQQNKGYPKGFYVPISKLHCILSVPNLLAYNNLWLCYGQVNSVRLKYSVASKWASKILWRYRLFCCWLYHLVLTVCQSCSSLYQAPRVSFFCRILVLLN